MISRKRKEIEGKGSALGKVLKHNVSFKLVIAAESSDKLLSMSMWDISLNAKLLSAKNSNAMKKKIGQLVNDIYPGGWHEPKRVNKIFWTLN